MRYITLMLVMLLLYSLIAVPVLAQDDCEANLIAATAMLEEAKNSIEEGNTVAAAALIDAAQSRIDNCTQAEAAEQAEAPTATAAFTATPMPTATADTTANGQNADVPPPPPPPQNESTVDDTSDSTGTVNTVERPPEFDGARSYLRVANFAPAVGSLDVYIDGQLSRDQSLAFPDVGAWLPVPAGNHTISIVPTGQSADAAIVAPATIDFKPDEWSTVTVLGSQADGTLIVKPVVEDHSELDLPSTSRTAYLNAMADNTRVDFTRDDVLFVSGLAPFFLDDNIQSYSSLPSDAFTFRYGIRAYNEESLLTESPDYDLLDGAFYLVAAVGTRDNPQVVVEITPRGVINLLTERMEYPGTVVEATQLSNLTAPFAGVIAAAGLTEELQSGGPYTIFVPVDYRIDELMSQYGDDPAALANVVRNHIVAGNYKWHDLIETDTLTSLTGNTLRLDMGQRAINGNGILDVNYAGVNGTLHIINGIMEP